MKKSSILKKLIKEAVKEAFQEEIKELLKESIISNKQPLREHSLPPVDISSTPQPETQPGDIRKNYMNILDNMMNPTTADVGPSSFTPTGGDTINGALPGGDVSIDQITKLMQG